MARVNANLQKTPPQTVTSIMKRSSSRQAFASKNGPTEGSDLFKAGPKQVFAKQAAIIKGVKSQDALGRRMQKLRLKGEYSTREDEQPSARQDDSVQNLNHLISVEDHHASKTYLNRQG